MDRATPPPPNFWEYVVKDVQREKDIMSGRLMYVCVKRYAFLLLEKYTTLGCCPRERSPKFPIPAIQVLESVLLNTHQN